MNDLSYQPPCAQTQRICSIGDDFIMIDDVTINDIALVRELMERQSTSVIVCRSGAIDLRIDFEQQTVESPAMIVTLLSQHIECVSISPNFEAMMMSMSDRFIDMLNISSRTQVFMALRNNPVIYLDYNTVNAVEGYREIIGKAISHVANPYRLEVVENFTRAFFYAGGLYFHELLSSRPTSFHNSILERFIDLVRNNYRQQRRVGFYADKLCITPKYLSKVVKQSSGQSAVEWIDSYVILEAKNLLKSSYMTIQQISVELNFPNQSFFGKYFKRMTGISPKEYREGGGIITYRSERTERGRR